jgi:hypothetical protein
MPRANPAASFEAAVRHLFRHLDDARELKRNPLVQQSALSVIRARIRAGAKDYFDSAGPDERVQAQRRLAILDGCLQGRSVKELATQLQMSLRQCYRERSLIYRYVAESLRRDEFKAERPVAHFGSVFEIEMERAAARAANGDYLLAMREYQAFIDEGSVCQKLQALISRAELELELGALRSAELSLTALSTCFAQADDLPTIETKASVVYMQFLEAKLAWERGSFGEASRRLSLARSASADFGVDPTERLRGLYSDIAIESANRAFDLGDFEATKAFLAAARESSDTLSGPPQRTANALLMEATLSFVNMRPGADIPLQDPIALASRAHSVALQCGSIKWRLRAEMFLTALQRATVNVMQRGELILSLAKSLHNPRLFAMLSLELADMLLETPSWRQADRLMRVTLPRESFYAGSFSMLKAVYRLKARAVPAAKKHAQVAHAIAQRAAAPRFQASTLRLLGCSSYMLGQRDQAADYISSAVPLAEQYGSAPARLKTFRTAALITGKRKYAREAERLASAMQ